MNVCSALRSRREEQEGAEGCKVAADPLSFAEKGMAMAGKVSKLWRSVSIVGVGCTPFGYVMETPELKDMTERELAAWSVMEALCFLAATIRARVCWSVPCCAAAATTGTKPRASAARKAAMMSLRVVDMAITPVLRPAAGFL